MTFSVQFCNGGDPHYEASNYSPVQVGIQNATDASRIMHAFRTLHPGLLWVFVEHDADGNGFKVRGYA